MIDKNKKGVKLTGKDVIEIRRQLAKDYLSQVEIAKRFGVTPSTIGNIKRNLSWRDK